MDAAYGYLLAEIMTGKGQKAKGKRQKAKGKRGWFYLISAYSLLQSGLGTGAD
jgi:hypothetical protein